VVVETSINHESGITQEVGNEERHLIVTGRNGMNHDTTAKHAKSSTSGSVGAARGIRVPAFTTIEACSVINFPALTYVVSITVSFYAKGLVAEEVEEILEEADVNGPYVHTDNFTVQVELERTNKGMLIVADLPVETKFYVNPVKVLGTKSCDSIKNDLNEVRQQTVLKLLEKMKQKRIHHGEL